ncbi:MAG: Dabb family protein [Bacteroidota bacterium]
MKKHIRIFWAALSCLMILSTLSTCAQVQAADETTVEKQEVKEPQKVLRHVVAFSFKEGITPEKQTAAIENFMSLKDEIPGILSFEGGEDVSVEGFTKDLTHCFILTFADEAARDAYLPHPGHMRVVKENKPLMSDLLVLDFWGED